MTWDIPPSLPDCAPEDKDKGTLKAADLLIDVGAASFEEAKKLVQVGDAAVYDTPIRGAGNPKPFSSMWVATKPMESI